MSADLSLFVIRVTCIVLDGDFMTFCRNIIVDLTEIRIRIAFLVILAFKQYLISNTQLSSDHVNFSDTNES